MTLGWTGPTDEGGRPILGYGTGELTLDAEGTGRWTTEGLLGTDYAQGPWTGGAVLSHSSGEGGYSGDSAGKVEVSMTALTPWAGYKVTERFSVWGALGYRTIDYRKHAQAARRSRAPILGTFSWL